MRAPGSAHGREAHLASVIASNMQIDIISRQQGFPIVGRGQLFSKASLASRMHRFFRGQLLVRLRSAISTSINMLSTILLLEMRPSHLDRTG